MAVNRDPLSSLHMLPEQHHPNLLLWQAAQLCAPSPLSHALRMRPPYLSPVPVLQPAGRSLNNPSLLIWGLQVLQPSKHSCVSLLRLGQWCLWLLAVPAPQQGLLLPLQQPPADTSSQVLSSRNALSAPLLACVSAITSLAGRDLAADRQAVPPGSVARC